MYPQKIERPVTVIADTVRLYHAIGQPAHKLDRPKRQCAIAVSAQQAFDLDPLLIGRDRRDPHPCHPMVLAVYRLAKQPTEPPRTWKQLIADQLEAMEIEIVAPDYTFAQETVVARSAEHERLRNVGQRAPELAHGE